MKKLFSILLVGFCISIAIPSVASAHTVKAHESGYFTVDSKVSKTEVSKDTIVTSNACVVDAVAYRQEALIDLQASSLDHLFVKTTIVASNASKSNVAFLIRPGYKDLNYLQFTRYSKKNIHILNCNIRQCIRA